MDNASKEWQQKKYLRFMFCCGIDWPVFNAKYEEQAEAEKQRLQRVAWRMWVTLKLRYGITTDTHIPTMGWEAEFKYTDIEWPSLEVYLLVTCLDTLAGKPDYQGFDDWLKQQDRFTDLDTDGVIKLLQGYRKEHGPRQTIRKLFTDLPHCVKEWLSHNVVIQRSNEFFEPDNLKQQDADILVKRLFNYFYDYRRNEFTHGSVTRQTTKAQNIDPLDKQWTLSIAGWEYTTEKKSRKRYWSLYHRHGLDEATILRVIIQVVVLQKLKIELNSSLIEKNVENQSRLSALYGFVSEIYRNAQGVTWWPHFDENAGQQINSLIGYSGIPEIDCVWTPILIDRLTEHSLEQQPRKMALQYLRAAKKLNTAIGEFNSSKPPFPSSSPTAKTDWVEFMQAAKSFLNNLLETEAYDIILNAPSCKEMKKIRLIIIRDPCYS